MENDNNNVNTGTNTEPPAPAPAPAGQPQGNEVKTYTQDQLDAIIAREKAKATKGWFTAEQMQAKDTSISTLTAERDNARADLATAQKERDNLLNEKFLRNKGVPEDMLEFVAFKIGKLVTDKKTFEQAAEEYLKDNPPAGTVRMSTGGGVGGGSHQPPSSNDVMNALIRGATK